VLTAGVTTLGNLRQAASIVAAALLLAVLGSAAPELRAVDVSVLQQKVDSSLAAGWLKPAFADLVQEWGMTRTTCLAGLSSR
jgi:hypothetical protein